MILAKFKPLPISGSHFPINILISFNGSIFLKRNAKLCHSAGNHPVWYEDAKSNSEISISYSMSSEQLKSKQQFNKKVQNKKAYKVHETFKKCVIDAHSYV